MTPRDNARVAFDRAHMVVRVDLVSLLDQADPDTVAQVVDALAVTDAVIEQVAAQIFDGYTSLDTHGYCHFTIVEPSTPLEKAKRRLAEMAGEAAREQIERLVADAKRAEDRERGLRDEVYKLREQVDTLNREIRTCHICQSAKAVQP